MIPFATIESAQLALPTLANVGLQPQLSTANVQLEFSRREGKDKVKVLKLSKLTKMHGIAGVVAIDVLNWALYFTDNEKAEIAAKKFRQIFETYKTKITVNLVISSDDIAAPNVHVVRYS